MVNCLQCCPSIIFVMFVSCNCVLYGITYIRIIQGFLKHYLVFYAWLHTLARQLASIEHAARNGPLKSLFVDIYGAGSCRYPSIILRKLFLQLHIIARYCGFQTYFLDKAHFVTNGQQNRVRYRGTSGVNGRQKPNTLNRTARDQIYLLCN